MNRDYYTVLKFDVNNLCENNAKSDENNLRFLMLCNIVSLSFLQEEAIMNRQAIVNLSTEILLRYYDNDVSMFLPIPEKTYTAFKRALNKLV